MDTLCDREIRQEFQVKIGGAFERLLELGDGSVQELWLDVEETTHEITKKVIGFRCRKQVVNLSKILAIECEERRRARTEYLKNTSNAEKRETELRTN